MEQSGVEDELAINGLGVRIKQELVAIPAKAVLGFPGSIDSKPIASAGRQVFDIAMEDAEHVLGQGNARFDTGVVEGAQFDACSTRGPQRDVRSTSAVRSDAQGVGATR